MDIRPITGEEYATFHRTFQRAMSFPPSTDEAIERMKADLRPERTLAAFDRDQMVGSADSYLFELTVPGGAQVDVAGVTRVGVLATHRRRGLLTQMMQRQLSEARDRGEAMAILIASESVIYGRFGYGVSSYHQSLEIDTRYRDFRPAVEVSGKVSFVDDETADKVFPEVYDRWRKQQPSAIPRSEAWWANLRADTKPGHDSYAVHEDGEGNVDGYVRYHVNSKWENTIAASSVDVGDLITITPEAAISLWRHLLDLDLVRTVKAWARPVDEPLRSWLSNPRALTVSGQADFFWTRILDIPASLGARTYRNDGSLVIEVDDAMFPDNTGRYALTIDGGAAMCEESSASPDLAMSIADLGGIFLGGVRASELARAGRVKELTPRALEKADAAVSSAPQPWSATGF